ncbi:MAG: hypothetical protein WBG86_01910 [Polyangiales bacterium]
MQRQPPTWEKLGCLVRADGTIPWMHGFTGAGAMVVSAAESPRVDLYITGRDSQNRSMIGRARLDLASASILEIEPEPVLTPGSLGAFDENGVSYPTLLRHGGDLYMFYTGWMPTVLTPFQNHIGLAKLEADGKFHRVSRAPVLPRTHEDYLSMGSSFATVEDGVWHLWYTSFLAWGGADSDAPKHRYEIKYAHSPDGRAWTRSGDQVCIGAEHPEEHSICRPSVLKIEGRHHMWYCYRGTRYRIGYAVSQDGIRWTRSDAAVGIAPSGDGWDSHEQGYPHVIRHGDWLYMVYCGNGFGRDGIGLARLPVASLRA